jgi:hypothetical protein
LETNKTFKPTNSGVENIRASEQNAHLSFVHTLACNLRPSPDAAPKGAKQEKWGGMPALGRLLVLRSHGPLEQVSHGCLDFG